MRKLLIIVIALTIAFAGHAQSSAPADAQSTASPPIQSASDLARYQQHTPAGKSPLHLLSPGGRKRFLGQLEFGKNGLGTFSVDDPEHELTHRQIVRLFSLFGMQDITSGLGLTPQEHATIERERRNDAKSRGCTFGSCPESEIERQFDTLTLSRQDFSLPDQQRFARVGKRYDHLFGRYQNVKALRQVSRSDLRLLKRAAETAVFYVPSSTHITQLQMDLAQMQKRGMTDDRDFTKLYRALVATRQLEDAAKLAQQHPGMDVHPLPTLRKSVVLPPNQPTALTLSANGQTMTRQAFDMSTPLRIVVVASCHFSQDAARAIKGDPKLRALFAEHAIWLASQSDSFPVALQWNHEFPEQPIHIAWQDSEWSMLKSWAMPTFYVFRHGKLVKQWSGWPHYSTDMQTLHKNMQALRKKLTSAGVKY